MSNIILSDELVIDNFAGGGGASTGIEMAIGRSVDIAINHDDEAIAMHKANHPSTRHYCQSIMSVDPLEVTGGRPVALAWFSPDCKHFSKAKGGKPVEKRIRDLAWVVIHWVERLGPNAPRVIMLENVEEFRTWGPLGEDNRPCPKRRGETFDLWTARLRKAGYKVEFRELRGCNYGAPTTRKRMFMIARRDGRPIIWPEPTHGPGKPLPWPTAADIIDWSQPCPSIFERQRPLADATLRRTAAGIVKYVINAAKPFIVPICNTGWGGDRSWPIDEPLRTITTVKGGDMMLAVPTLITAGYGERDGQLPRVPGLHKPLGTVVAGGGKHALIAAFMAQHNGGPRNTGIAGRAADAPISTITARGTQQNVVASHLIKLRNNCFGGDLRQPLDTVTSGGTHFGEIRAFLIKYYGNEFDGHDLTNPLGTVTTRDRFGLVTVSIDGQDYVIADIGMRMLTPRELFLAQGFPAQYIIDCAGPTGKPLTKTAQTRMCGNSVNPPIPAALVSANLPELCQQRMAA